MLSPRTRPVGDGNTRPPPSSSWRASSRICTARGDSGTRCSSFAFMRVGGTVQVAVSASTSSQRRAADLSGAAGGQDEELEGERGCRVGTRFADSGECRGDLCLRQRPLVFAAGGVLRQRGGHGTYP